MCVYNFITKFVRKVPIHGRTDTKPLCLHVLTLKY